jgi:hypothetical protein
MTAESNPKPFAFTIQRSKWIRGYDHGDSCLLRDDGCMCCLGFYCIAAGARKEDVLGITTPSSIRRGGLPRAATWLVDGSSGDCGSLLTDNDSPDLESLARESRIRDLFARHNVRVTFAP